MIKKKVLPWEVIMQKEEREKIKIELFVELFLSRFPFIIFTLMPTFVPVT